MIVAHNHTGGDPNPSPDDVAVTRNLVQVGRLLDIELIDHLVITSDNFTPVKERYLGFE